MPFQIKAKNIFLTYPQCNLDEFEFHEAFWNQAWTNSITGYCIAQEKHDDGNLHYHVVAHNPNSFRTRNHEYFDISFNARTYHGNYQACRNVRDALKYIRKDGYYSEDLGPLRAHESNEKKTWSDIWRSENYEEACELVERHFPRDWAISGERIRANLGNKFLTIENPCPPPTYRRDEFANVPQALEDWVRNELFSDKVRKLSLILCGPTRTGKSSWARSLGTHIYQMSALTPRTVLEKDQDDLFIVLDDIEQGTIEKSQLSSCYKSFLGCQPFLTLHDKYKPPKQISWGIPCIWLCNAWPVFADMEYVNDNVVKVLINVALY